MARNIFSKRIVSILLLKIVIVVMAFGCAFLVRFDFSVPDDFWSVFRQLLPAVIAIKLVVFFRLGIFQGWWRYVSLADVFDIFKANLVASVTVCIYVVFAHGLAGVPRSVLILDGLFCFTFACGIRVATRAFRENYFPMPRTRKKKFLPILVYGAGRAGQSIVRGIRQNSALGKRVVGFIDDDPDKMARKFMGVPVLGGREDFLSICHDENIREVIIALPSGFGREVRDIVTRCDGSMIQFKILPGIDDLIGGNVSLQQIRDVSLEDLLGREPIVLEVELVRAYLTSKVVLVTGAGGSIGSEMCRQIASYDPEMLILFDCAETPLFDIEMELKNKFSGLSIVPVLGDIRDRAVVMQAFEDYIPNVVFHAAAYKHVPMLEQNPTAAVFNNIRGTKIVADISHENGVESFVLISSDKAVNPENIMGATKRAAEEYVRSLSAHSQTNFVAVRFGNVLGSNGSVVPIFSKQIQNGGPVTVTHPDVTRYFMTIPEAVQLVLQASSMGKGGEVFLLDMGSPLKILALAEQLIRLSGYSPYDEIDIIFTGLRPGERLHEILLQKNEKSIPTHHEKINIVVSSAPPWNNKEMNFWIAAVYDAIMDKDKDTIYKELQKIIP